VGFKERVNVQTDFGFAIHDDRRSSPANKSMAHIRPSANLHLPLRNSTTILNIMLVGTPQSSMIVDLHVGLSMTIDP